MNQANKQIVPAGKRSMRLPLWWIKLTRYEYWTWYWFFVPMLPYYLYLAARARSFTFFTAANPGIDEAGGLFGESKRDILAKIPAQYLPNTLFIDAQTPWETLSALVMQYGLGFPLIAKPDVGERGTRVSKIDSWEALQQYWETYDTAFLLQEYLSLPIELGVMYYRLPGAALCRVSSLTAKRFLGVVGDGQRSVEKLMLDNTRARFQLARFRREAPDVLARVPALGEEVLLEPIGNHCRGTEFINAHSYITPQLHQVFTKIANHLDGFYYGRFDLKVASWDDLYAGKVKIMEVNGVSSEPAHVYDPRYTLWQAYRDVGAHWWVLYRISRLNRRAGVPYLSLAKLWQIVSAHFLHPKHTALLPE